MSRTTGENESSDTNITHSHQLEYYIPVSRISSLSSGEFVGTYEELPVEREVTHQMLLDNFHQIRKDIATLIDSELDRISNTSELRHLLIE
jgi:hypothetical protein